MQRIRRPQEERVEGEELVVSYQGKADNRGVIPDETFLFSSWFTGFKTHCRISIRHGTNTCQRQTADKESSDSGLSPCYPK